MLIVRCRAKILDQLVVAYRADMHHLDFEERNVLVQNGEYRITDLRDVVDHQFGCNWSYKFSDHIGEDEYRPDPLDRDCGLGVIRRLASTWGFWNDSEHAFRSSLYGADTNFLPCR